jgi:TRAP-type C4-dicarboxylate transport system permease small subunit
VSDQARPLGRPALGRFDIVEEVIACAALVVVVLAVCWGVLTRYVTAQPAAWTGEIAGMGFAWLVFLGAAAGFKRRLHVSIDLLTQHLPRPLERALALLVQVGILAFAAYVCWLGVGFTVGTLDNPSPVLRLPQSIIYLAVTLGFLSIGLRQACWLGRRLLGRGAAA